MPVSGPGIPAGDTIAAITNGGDVQLSGWATATGTVPLTFCTTGSVFEIDAGARVAMSGLTISDGNAVQGGGINNAGTLTLTNEYHQR